MSSNAKFRMLGRFWLIAAVVCGSRVHAQFAVEPTDAKRRDDADIFLSGAMTAAKNAASSYQWDIKIAYPKYKGEHWFVSPLIDFVANKGTDANPDKAKFVSSVGYAIPVSTPQFNLIPEVQIINESGGEFDREFATKGFVSSTYARVLFRTFGSTVGERVAPLFDFGMDFGSNLSNKLSKDGSGAVARIYAGTSWYKELGSPNVVMVAAYQVRIPLRDEIFQQKIGDGTRRFLSTKARHFVEIGFDYGLSKYFSLKPKYRWGSLPPAYSFLDHQLSIALEIKAQVVQR